VRYQYRFTDENASQRAMTSIMGWDIGGAHVKAALLVTGEVRWAQQVPCPLWKGMEHLEAAINELLELAKPNADVQHAVTMTGELVDLFSSRAQGVQAIVNCVERRLPHTHFFAGTQGFLSAKQACENTEAVASANWFATAQYLAVSSTAQQSEQVLIDIGSTTTDIIALKNKQVLALGVDDFTRLANDELVYTGCARTALMALMPRVNFEGKLINVMAEYFATTADIYRITGELDEASDQHPAADNGEKTAHASARRVARMIGRDVESATMSDWRKLAEEFSQAQTSLISSALVRVWERAKLRAPSLMLTGSGAFIGEKVAAQLGLKSERLSVLMKTAHIAHADACAPAIATAWLMQSKA
jgi:(4-(4-[2-(gamma-L-glutamylamino)ethyl]phenoxymethyl)furan-2-yl)methanamine synthase